MTDIWDEKPEPEVLSDSEGHEVHKLWYYHAELELWLRKLKAHYKAIEEKAEKYDPIVEMFNNHVQRLNEEREKLLGEREAVKKWMLIMKASLSDGVNYFTLENLHGTMKKEIKLLEEILGADK